MNTKNPIFVGVVAFIVGWAIGLFIFGWGISPVQYEGATPYDLSASSQEQIVVMTAELYSLNHDVNMANDALNSWKGDEVACRMAANEADPLKAQKLTDAATAVNGQGCNAVAETSTDAPAVDPEEEGGSSRTTLFLLLLLLVLIGLAMLFLNRRRKDILDGGRSDLPDTVFGTKPKDGPEGGDDDASFDAVPIAKFQTTYNHGHESFDDSFSIEKADGSFLGECGVSIAESIGSDSPKSVAAIEVWLFDKNDIRTITRVAMSEHAFYDEAMKAKLAPKGEPSLAKENEIVVLETAALIINVELKGLQYGESDALPPQSYFERVTFELSAWAKEESGTPDAGADDVMEF